jgi:hypothetical protein
MDEAAVIATVSFSFVAFISVLAVILKTLDNKSKRKEAQQLLDRRPISYTRIDDHNEWEAETANGRRFRSNNNGILWYSFPDGNRANLDQEDELEEGLARHKRLEKWTSQ